MGRSRATEQNRQRGCAVAAGGGLYLSVTRFLMRFPRSEKPRCMGLLAPASRNVFASGELGSDACLSMRMGLGLRAVGAGTSADDVFVSLGASCRANSFLRSSMYISISWSSFSSISSTWKRDFSVGAHLFPVRNDLPVVLLLQFEMPD